MKRRKGLSLVIFAALAVSLFAMTGCGSTENGDTLDEPDITVDYLEDEYADQLITDGAGTMVGYITLEKDGDDYVAEITEKEVVPSSSYEEGYYIADTNISLDATLGSDARLTFADKDDAQVVTADEFIDKQADNPDALYTVYLMGDSAELILATDPESFLEDSE